MQATQPAESEAEPHHHKHVAVPDADDQVDPWAEQAQEFQSRPLQGFSQPQSRAQESVTSRGPVTSHGPVASRGPVAGGVSSRPQTGTPAQAQDPVSGGISLQGFAGSDASQGQGSVQAPQAVQQVIPQSSQPAGDRAFQPQQDASGSVGPEDDEYSLDDADISEGMSIEEIAKSFDAKEVRDITEDGNGAV